MKQAWIELSTVDEKVQAFVPAPLPPYPPVGWAPKLSGVVREIAAQNLN